MKPIVPKVQFATCPHLGFIDDRETSALYPRPDHVCFLSGVKNPDFEWQSSFCIGTQYHRCPYFRRASESEDLRDSSNSLPSRRFVKAAASFSAAAILTVGGFGLHDALSTPGKVESKTYEANSVGARESAELTQLTPTLINTSSTVATPNQPTPTATSQPTSAVTPEPTPIPSPASPTSVAGLATPSPSPTILESTPESEPGVPPTAHVVEPGETLAEIAARYNTTTQAILAVNEITDPNHIEAGWTLVIPGGADASR